MRTHRIKQQLLNRRRALLARYHSELALAEEELETPESEEVELATEQWDARVLSRLSDADARSLGFIVAALRRLEAGTYGTCTECGGAIEPTRLEAMPEAAVCIDCALDAERPRRGYALTH